MLRWGADTWAGLSAGLSVTRLPTEFLLSDDRGELREIAADRYGADTPPSPDANDANGPDLC